MTAHRTSHLAPARPLLWLVLALAGLLFGYAGPGFTQAVVPSPQVATGVVIRAAPNAAAPSIGLLRPGQSMALKAVIPHWNEVTLPDGRDGYVSKTWTVVAGGGSGEAFTVHVIDVGTGLAVFVEGPDFAAIYDGGSNDDLTIGSGNRLLAYLHKVRPDLRTIDHLILSHPHRDHVELLPDVLAAYQVRNVWDSGRVNPICGYRAFLKATANEPGVAYHDAIGDGATREVPFTAKTCYGVPLPAETIALDEASRIDDQPVKLGAGAAMTFLHADGTMHPSPNENSLVVRMDLGGVRILFTGDGEAGGRKDPSSTPDAKSVEGLLLACCRAALKADIMFAGHHGSMTSSRAAFLSAVGAKTFIISSGPTRYATVVLPDQVVVDRLKARGAVWRTDVNDAACAANPHKIGPDADGNAGGCDNIVVRIKGSAVSVADEHPVD